MQRIRPKRWSISPKIPPSIQNSLRNFHPVLAQVLYNRGFSDGKSALEFLTGELPDVNPFEMAGMNKAVSRLRQAIRLQEPIAVYGDFDTDGVTSTALLVQTFRALGGVVEPYIPHRTEDGYDLNVAALSQMAKDGFKLVVTVDCGIRAIQEVLDGSKLGLDIIITDHHSVGPEMPEAFAIVNPKRLDCDYGEDMLAGVGVAYRLADALLRAAAAAGETVPGLKSEDLLDLVAIGTVADLAPMDRQENRALVIEGLKILNAARRPGLYALMDETRLRPGTLKAANIGYGLGPRLNAAGRMRSAIAAYELLMTNDMKQAEALVRELTELNSMRQDQTRISEDLARKVAHDASVGGDLSLIFAADESFLPGIVGLTAGRLMEEFYRPAVVIGMGENGEGRGSCRSIPEFDIVQALDQCADLLVRHGGHAQAAGFTVNLENLDALQERLTLIADKALAGQDLRPSLDVDAEVPMDALTTELALELERLEPTGKKNPQPLLATFNIPILDVRRVGKEGAHLKMVLGEGSFRLDAIAFRKGDLADDLPRRVDVVYHFEINEWNGRQRCQLNVRDIRPSE